jgi:hypothetical protein
MAASFAPLCPHDHLRNMDRVPVRPALKPFTVRPTMRGQLLNSFPLRRIDATEQAFTSIGEIRRFGDH